jgi:U1 small nuclear ribonucleoprotein
MALFAPRQPLQYIPPTEKHKLLPYTGVADYLQFFETKDQHATVEPFVPPESRRQRAERIEAEKKQRAETKVRDELRKCKIIIYLANSFTGDPQNDTNIEGDPFNTLFVAKLVCVKIILLITRRTIKQQKKN